MASRVKLLRQSVLDSLGTNIHGYTTPVTRPSSPARVSISIENRKYKPRGEQVAAVYNTTVGDMITTDRVGLYRPKRSIIAPRTPASMNLLAANYSLL